MGLLQQCSYAPVNESAGSVPAGRELLLGGRSRRFANHCCTREQSRRARTPPTPVRPASLQSPCGRRPPSPSPSTPAPPASGPWWSTSGPGGRHRLPGAHPALPPPGWVEHDADEIWRAVARHPGRGGRTTGRRRPGGPVHRDHQPARDRRGLGPVDRWAPAPGARVAGPPDRRAVRRPARPPATCPLVREQTGLVLDPYFSASKMQWLLEEGGVPTGPDLALATVDTWVLWNLTGGVDGGVFATDVTNASRTMLFDIVVRRWSDELCDLFGVPASALAEVRPSCGRFGTVAAAVARRRLAAGRGAGQRHGRRPARRPVRPGLLRPGHDQGHLRHRQLRAHERRRHLPAPGRRPGHHAGLGPGRRRRSRATAAGSLAYAVEGSVFVAGAGVQWLRDGLGIIDRSAELEPLARSVDSSEGGGDWSRPSPDWAARTGTPRPGAPSPGSAGAPAGPTWPGPWSRPWASRCATCSTPWRPPARAARVVRVDGGAAVMGLLLQHLADQARLEVVRPRVGRDHRPRGGHHGRAGRGGLGLARRPGRACGRGGRRSPPRPTRPSPTAAHAAWLRSVDRSRGWASGQDAG